MPVAIPIEIRYILMTISFLFVVRFWSQFHHCFQFNEIQKKYIYICYSQSVKPVITRNDWKFQSFHVMTEMASHYA